MRDCAAECDAILQMLLAHCILADGTIDPDCAAGAGVDFDYDQCVRDCEAQNGGDPAVFICQGDCYTAYANGLAECAAADGTVDPACVAAKDIAFVQCFVSCGQVVPWLPDLATCVPPCTAAYEEGLAACRADDGSLDFACFGEKRQAYNDCLGACGLSLLPLEDLCVRRCEKAFLAALSECGTVVGPNGDPAGGVPGDDGMDPGDPECVARAQSAFDACLTGCGIMVPDELRCAAKCDQALQAQLAMCAMDPNCESAALDEYTACLSGCGIVVPPIPEPDPCVSECDLRYQDAVGLCFDPATGDVDVDCLLQADTDYLACLEGCGIILPEPPPDADPMCTGPCELAYQQALEQCFTAEANGMAIGDDECIAAADSAYLRCLEACGVEPGQLPGDPGFPAGECEQGCGVAILGALFDCAAANGGAVDEECLLRVGDAFNECLAACQDAAGERVLGALARAGNGPFVRGDVDRDGSLQITDPVRVLSYLFLGDGEILCDDAADANDDGRINISDPIAILNHLFLGAAALPAPTGSPGTDPTPDMLGCSSR
jgi:hypothetical protein